MKITDVEVIVLRYEYPAGQGFQFAGGYCNARLSCLVRVHTDAGITGLGSVYSHPELVRCTVESHLRELIVGEDATQVESLWERMYRATRWYGRKGLALSAISGIDIALWDIRGKVEGKPLFKLLGASRDRVPAYASGLLWTDDLNQLQREAERHVRDGFGAMKMRLGRNSEYDHEALRRVRAAVGQDVPLMVDGNARYTLDQALDMADELRTCRAFWFEEPFVPEDHDSFLQFRKRCDIRLAAGENEFGLQGFRELVEKDVVDILQPDSCRCGGVTEALRIGRYCMQRGRQVATHTWNDAVALTANLHVVASLSNGIYVEMDRTGTPLMQDLLTEPIQVINGEAVAPDRPGLGIEIREDVLEELAVPKGQPFPAGNYSDLVFGRDYFCSVPGYDEYPLATANVRQK